MRERIWTTALLLAAPVLLLCLARRSQGGEVGFPVDRDSLPLWTLACCAWLCGLLMARLCASAARQRARTARALAPLLALPPGATNGLPGDLLRQLRLESRARIVRLDAPVALCHGLLWPRLLLSTGLAQGLSAPELEAVLLHEAAHLRRRDPLRLVLARALAEALPLPILARLADVVPVAQELAADRAVLAAVGSRPLAGALLKLGDALGPVRELTLAIGPFGEVDARIAQVLGDPMPRLSPSRMSVLPILLGIALIPLLCFLPLPAFALLR